MKKQQDNITTQENLEKQALLKGKKQIKKRLTFIAKSDIIKQIVKYY